MTKTQCTCLGLPMGPDQTCDAHQLPTTIYAWCFSHGRLHTFTGEPWCTATWVALPATTETDAREAKCRTYGGARFLHELPIEQQTDVIDAREAQR